MVGQHGFLTATCFNINSKLSFFDTTVPFCILLMVRFLEAFPYLNDHNIHIVPAKFL